MRRSFLAVVFAALALAVSFPAAAADEVRAFWVDSFNPGLRSPEQIDALIGRVKLGNMNTIVAQVRRNAQALYSNRVEPVIEGYVPPAGFDPLQYLIEKAHAEGIEVHAWVNIGPIFSGHPTIPTGAFPCRRPCDPNHIFNTHGYGVAEDQNWLTRNHPSYLSGTTFGGQRTSPGGLWFMDLGHPAAAEHTIGVLTHLLKTYDVDGIHLDYIRYPEMPIAISGTLAFATGYNPTSVKRFNEAYSRAPGSLPDPRDASWSQWRREQVTAFVRRLYLEMGFIRPDAKLSAALIVFYRGPNTTEPRTFQQTEPYYRVFQNWSAWMQEGILDLSIPMIYKNQGNSEHRRQFDAWNAYVKDAQYDRHGLLGLGAYMNSLPFTLTQIELGRAASPSGNVAHGFNFFSYNQTSGTISGAPLEPRDNFFPAVTVDGAYTPVAPFREAASIPAMTWKTDPRKGHLLTQVIGEDGAPADGALVTIRKMGAGPNDEEIVQYADGNGFVGGVDLQPGAYQLLIQIPGSEDRLTIPEPVVPGRVTRVVANLSRPSRGPLARAEHVFGANERNDHLVPEASPLEEWIGHEPPPEPEPEP